MSVTLEFFALSWTNNISFLKNKDPSPRVFNLCLSMFPIAFEYGWKKLLFILRWASGYVIQYESIWLHWLHLVNNWSLNFANTESYQHFGSLKLLPVQNPTKSALINLLATFENRIFVNNPHRNIGQNQKLKSGGNQNFGQYRNLDR